MNNPVENTKVLKNRAACKAWREKNKAEIKRKRQSVSVTAEFKAKRNIINRKNRNKNPDYNKLYRAKNLDRLKLKRKALNEKYPEKLRLSKKRDKENQRKNLTNEYIKVLLSKKINIPYSEVNKYPKLIELHRQILKIKRYAKQNKN